MDQPEYISEIARLSRQIDQDFEVVECALTAPAITDRHDVIDVRTRRIWDHTHALAQYIGVAAATKVLVDAYKKILG